MIQIPDSEIEFTFSRSSGPGGQNVNKVNSKVQLRWNVLQSRVLSDEARVRFIDKFGTRVNDAGEVVIASDRYRDQPKNKEDCLAKLHGMVAEILHPPKKRKKSKPSRGSQRRRRESKQRHSDKKAARGKFY